MTTKYNESGNLESSQRYIMLHIFEPDIYGFDVSWKEGSTHYKIQGWQIGGEAHGRLSKGEMGSDFKFWGEVIKSW
jgi:hypothetical protein